MQCSIMFDCVRLAKCFGEFDYRTQSKSIERLEFDWVRLPNVRLTTPEIFQCFGLQYTFFRLVRQLRASSHKPGWPGWPGYRDQFRLGFKWEISVRFPRWEQAKYPRDDFWREMRKSKHAEAQKSVITFAPVIALVTLIAVSLQLNGMLMMWEIQQAKQEDPGGQSSSRFAADWDPGWKNRDLGNRFSPPSQMNTSKILRRI